MSIKNKKKNRIIINLFCLKCKENKLKKEFIFIQRQKIEKIIQINLF